MSQVVHRYPSLTAAVDDYRRLGNKVIPHWTDYWERTHWDSENRIRRALEGDPRVVPQAEALLRKVESSIELPTTEWTPSVVGAYPMVPDALAGVPDAMRTRTRIASEQVPLNICVFGSFSQGVDAQGYKQRGIAILALVLALQRVRPITLEVFNIGKNDYVNAAVINTSPMDLATASVFLSSSHCMATIFYGLEYAYTGDVTWPARYSPFSSTGRSAYLNWLRGPLGLKDTDLLIEPAFFYDFERDQAAWINKQVKKFTENQEEVW